MRIWSERWKPRRQRARILWVPAALIAPLLCAAPFAPAGTLSVLSTGTWVKVRHVVDGDTFVTADGRKVRLLGINAPEIRHDREPGQPLGEAARLRLASLIEFENVRLSFDAERKDRYGRWLAQIYRRDGTWVNERLVREGLAHVYTFAPNLRWCDRLLRAERKAQLERRGIWATKAFRILDAGLVEPEHIGRFRVWQGTVRNPRRWRFRLGRLQITVPRKYRKLFGKGLTLQEGERVLVRGVVRAGRGTRLYLALHTPCDLNRLLPPEAEPETIAP